MCTLYQIVNRNSDVNRGDEIVLISSISWPQLIKASWLRDSMTYTRNKACHIPILQPSQRPLMIARNADFPLMETA